MELANEIEIGPKMDKQCKREKFSGFEESQMQEGEALRVPTIQSVLFLCALLCRGGGFGLVERNFYAAPATRQESGLACIEIPG